MTLLARALPWSLAALAACDCGAFPPTTDADSPGTDAGRDAGLATRDAGARWDAAVPPLDDADLDLVPLVQRPAGLAELDGTYLAVWSETHNGHRLVRATRVDADGAALDLGGIVLGEGDDPRVAANESEFLVVWSARTGDSSDIVGVGVRADGTIVDRAPIRIESGAEQGFSPAIAADGSTFVVAWLERAPDDRIGLRIARVESGALRGGATTLSDDVEGSGISVAATGGEALVLWARPTERFFDVAGARVRIEDGTVIGELAVATDAFSPRVAARDGEYALMWTDGLQWFAARLPAGGELVPWGLLPVEPGAVPAITGDGAGFAVSWLGRSEDVSALRVARLSAGSIDPAETMVERTVVTASGPFAAFAGESGIAIWSDGNTDVSSMRAARIEPGATARDIGRNARFQTNAALASNGEVALLAFSEYRGATGWDVLARRLWLSDGRFVDAEPIEIDTRPGDQEVTAAASDGDDFALVWTDDGASQAAVIDTESGAVERELDLPEGRWNTLRAGASGYLLAGGGSFARIEVVAWPFGGSPGAPVRLDVSDASYSVSAAAIGDEFLVAWTDTDTNYEIVAQRVSIDGSLLGPRLDVSARPTFDNGASVSVLGGSWFVAWEAQLSTAGGTGVLARTVAADGTIGPEISLTEEDPSWPAVFDGPSGTLVTWIESYEIDSGMLVLAFADGSSPVRPLARVPQGTFPDAVWTGSGFAVGYPLRDLTRATRRIALDSIAVE